MVSAHERELATGRFRRWISCSTTEALRMHAADPGLPDEVRLACATEVESRAIQAVAFPGIPCWG
jgi:hypothetical protein